MARKPVQFNFRRLWRRKVEPHLPSPIVQGALDLGMSLLDRQWKTGDPPHALGRLGFTPTGRKRRVVRGKLSWYQPLGRCHWIVFFTYVLGHLIHPHLRWDIVTGDLHTVAVGFDGNGDPEVVMDILLFHEISAEESLRRARMKVEAVEPSNMDECYRMFVTGLVQGKVA